MNRFARYRWLVLAASLAASVVILRATSPDDSSQTPVPAVLLSWGDPLATDGDDLLLDETAMYVTDAGKIGGFWLSSGGWAVNASDPDFAALRIGLDRTLIAGDLPVSVVFYDSANAALYADLLDEDGMPIATNIVGNLLRGSSQTIEAGFTLPLVKNPDATVVQLRCDYGASAVYLTILGQTANQSSAATNSVPGKDTVDGTNAAVVTRTVIDAHQSSSLTDAMTAADTTGTNSTVGGTTNGAPTAPRLGVDAHIVYVDARHGSDWNTGRMTASAVASLLHRQAQSLSQKSTISTELPTTSTNMLATNVTAIAAANEGGADGMVSSAGPKATVSAGLAAVKPRGTVVICDGAYHEPLKIAGRSVQVRISGRVNITGRTSAAPASTHVRPQPPPLQTSVTNRPPASTSTGTLP